MKSRKVTIQGINLIEYTEFTEPKEMVLLVKDTETFKNKPKNENN